MTPHQAARLLDIGTRLQRSALTGEHLPPPAPLVDVEELSPLEADRPVRLLAPPLNVRRWPRAARRSVERRTLGGVRSRWRRSLG